MLKDAFGRRFQYLRLSVTDVCNFRCNYCLPDGYQKPDVCTPFLSVAEIINLASAFVAAGTLKIRITGGEPLLRPDLADIVSGLSSTAAVSEIAMTTNAYNLAPRIPALRDAGLDSVNISMDSLDPSVFRLITGHNRLHQVLKAVDGALTAGFRNVKVNVVLMQAFNASDLNAFMEWVRMRPLTLRFIEVMRTNDNPDFYRQQHVSGEQLREQLLCAGWTPLQRSVTSGPATEYQHENYQGRIGLITPYSPGFCDDCNRLRVSATGKLHLCLFGNDGYDLRPYLASPDQRQELLDYIAAVMPDKKATHPLLEDSSGSRANLSTIGG